MRAIIYRGKDRKWYAKIIARNGKNIFHSGDGYERKAGALHAVKTLKSPTLKIVFQE
jgi:uncharacterized protein YegP (UPF0339 family)